jgi:transcriptional regulator with XRE-family HTH domain
VGDGSGGGSPIGRRVRVWRRQRGIARADLAVLSGMELAELSAVEEGYGWWDQRGRLFHVVAVLRVGVEELTGQPYAGLAGADAVEVLGEVVRVRRALMGAHPAAVRVRPVGEVVGAAELGDDLALARDAVRVVAALNTPEAVDAGARGLVEGGVAVAGWLRRWGYRDLAWSVLHRVRSVGVSSPGLVAEEMRVLLDGGAPDRALEWAGYPGAVSPVAGPVVGVVLAVLGRLSEAEKVLAAAADAAGDVRGRAVVELARAVAAVEVGRPVVALECCARLPGADGCGAGLWSQVLVVRALAEARGGDVPAAARSLAEAARAAPLRTLVDPWARELLSVLPDRVPGRDGAVLRAFAARAGVLAGPVAG